MEIRTKGIKNDDGTIEVFGMAKDLTENVLLKKELNNSNKQKKLLSYLIEGTRGGKTRASILKYPVDRSFNEKWNNHKKQPWIY